MKICLVELTKTEISSSLCIYLLHFWNIHSSIHASIFSSVHQKDGLPLIPWPLFDSYHLHIMRLMNFQDISDFLNTPSLTHLTTHFTPLALTATLALINSYALLSHIPSSVTCSLKVTFLCDIFPIQLGIFHIYVSE